jgi:hypothetical protein
MLRRSIGLLVPLALGLLASPLIAHTQPPGHVYRIGYLATAPPPAQVL